MDIDEFLRRMESLIEASHKIWLVLDPSELQIDDVLSVQSLCTALLQLGDVSSQQKYEVYNRWSGVDVNGVAIILKKPSEYSPVRHCVLRRVVPC